MECVEKIIQRRPESLPYGIAGPSRVSGSQEQPIILSSDENIKIKTEKDTIEKDTIEKVTIEKVTEDTEKVTEEDTEKVTKEDTGSKKTVSKAFYFFLFLLFASHKFFF